MSKEIAIANEDVHLWVTFPDEVRDPDLLAAYWDMMTEEERRKQERFHFQRHRHQYLVTRALVRTTLSRHTGLPPEQWRFCLNHYGRPEIESPAGLAPLRFSLSHTEGIAACAVVLQSDIGLDVEDMNRGEIEAELADRFFSKTESRDLRALPPSVMRSRFFEYWTLKEAYIKAKGMGLSIPLDQFSFHMERNRTLRVSFDPLLHDQPNAWCFWLMQLTRRHKAALALNRGPDEPVRISIREVVPLGEERAVGATILRRSRGRPLDFTFTQGMEHATLPTV